MRGGGHSTNRVMTGAWSVRRFKVRGRELMNEGDWGRWRKEAEGQRNNHEWVQTSSAIIRRRKKKKDNSLMKTERDKANSVLV